MKIYFTSLFILLFTLNGFGQASLSGKVTDAETGEPILFGDVALYRNGALITGKQTDFDGNYVISPLEPGTYDIAFKYIGYSELKYNSVLASADKETTFNAAIRKLTNPKIVSVYSCGMIDRPLKEQKTEKKKSLNETTLKLITVTAYKRPLVNIDVCSQGTEQNIKSENCIKGIISQQYGCGSSDERKQLIVKSLHNNRPEGYLENLAVKMSKEKKEQTEDRILNDQFDVQIYPNPVSNIFTNIIT